MFKSDEDKVMSDPNIKWSQSSVIKNKKPKMTRQHFEAVANIICQFDKFNINTAQKRYITKCFISFFKTQNKNFDQKKFYNKCMVNSLDILEVEDLFIKDMEPNNNLKGGE